MKKILIIILILFSVLPDTMAEPGATDDMEQLVARVYTLLDASDRDRLFPVLNQIVKEARNSGNAKIYRDAVYEIGTIFKKIGLLDSARHYFEISMDMNFEMNDSVGIGMVKNQLGDIARYKSRPLEARQLFLDAIRILQTQDDKRELGKALNNLGALNLSWGEYNSVNHLFMKALEHYVDAGYREGIAWLQFSMSQLYKRIGEYDQALLYSKKSMRIYEQMAARSGDSTGVRICLSQMGFLYTHHFDSLDKALDYQMRVLRMSNKSGVKSVMADGNNGVGQVYYKMKQFELAKRYINRALQLRYDAGISNGVSNNLKYLGYIERDMGNYEKAKDYFNQAIKIASENRKRAVRNDVYRAFSSLHKKMGDYEQALFYMKKHLALKDSILSTEIAKKVASTQLQFEVDQKTQENKSLLQQNQIQQLQLQKSKLYRNYLIAIVSVVILIGFFIGYLLMKQRQIKTLFGLVPICTSCKKIRNDKGYYEQLEEYVSQHSEASFSHGLCPDCMEQLYPDLYHRMVKKRQQKGNTKI